MLLLEKLYLWKEDESTSIEDISPLSHCKRLKVLDLAGSIVTDLTALSSMLLLEKLYLWKDDESTSIEDISNFKRLKVLEITGTGNCNLRDLSPLCQCPDLEDLNISDLPLIEDLSFFEKGFTKLRVLNIKYLPVEDLSPLTRLQNLEELNCCDIPETTSFLPLARCYKLKKVHCPAIAMGIAELREKRPDLKIWTI
jgi:Leucine-rich repeat (LRR) protein